MIRQIIDEDGCNRRILYRQFILIAIILALT